MEVKEAVHTALRHAAVIFEDQQISDLCLEEVQYDDVADEWSITVGFTRPLARTGALAAVLPPFGPRVYKVVRVTQDGSLRSVMNRGE